MLRATAKLSVLFWFERAKSETNLPCFVERSDDGKDGVAGVFFVWGWNGKRVKRICHVTANSLKASGRWRSWRALTALSANKMFDRISAPLNDRISAPLNDRDDHL